MAIKTIKAKRKKKNPILKYVGQVGVMELEGMTFEVGIKAHKSAYGHDHLLVSPKRGEGEKWVRGTRLSLV